MFSSFVFLHNSGFESDLVDSPFSSNPTVHCYRECKEKKNTTLFVSFKITVIFKVILRTHNILKTIAMHNSVEFSKLSIVTHAFKKHILNTYCVLCARWALCPKS